MTATSTIALCSALAIDADDDAPEWLHLLPAGEITTGDGRGPYRVEDVDAVISKSLQAGKLVLDENHATDLAAPKGAEAPARGWIVDLQRRQDGVWGRVEWTPAAIERRVWREYRGISPVIAHLKNGRILAVLRASLVNQPNFKGLTALHQEKTMDLRTMLIEAMGLDSEADDAAIVAAVKAKMKGGGDEAAATAMQAALAPIAQAVGLSADADAAAVLTSIQAMVAETGDDEVITALQGQVTKLSSELNTLKTDRAQERAVAFVDGAIAAGRVGVKGQRDEYVTMHRENPGRAEKLINAMPVVKTGALLIGSPDTPAAGDAEDPTLIAAHATTYQKKLADAGVQISFATAVRDVQEGKHK